MKYQLNAVVVLAVMLACYVMDLRRSLAKWTDAQARYTDAQTKNTLTIEEINRKEHELDYEV